MAKKVETTEEYLARGGQIEHIPIGVMTFSSVEHCTCGCKGNYQRHVHNSMLTVGKEGHKRRTNNDKKWYSK